MWAVLPHQQTDLHPHGGAPPRTPVVTGAIRQGLLLLCAAGLYPHCAVLHTQSAVLHTLLCFPAVLPHPLVCCRVGCNHIIRIHTHIIHRLDTWRKTYS